MKDPIRDATLKSAQILDASGQVLATGEVSVGADGLCHFYPDAGQDMDFQTSPASVSWSGCLPMVVRDWQSPKNIARGGCQAHFRFQEDP